MDALILASSSPRRQEILKSLHIPYKVVTPNFKEIVPENFDIREVPEYFASQKVNAVVRSMPSSQHVDWVFGADTVIIFNGKLFGKPQNADEAKEMITAFSGKTHKVITSIALYNGNLHYLDTKTSINSVTFKEMNEEEIDWYVNTGEWHGVAGGYRIQELAQCFISKIEGSFSSIMGLPISEFYDILREHKFKFDL